MKTYFPWGNVHFHNLCEALLLHSNTTTFHHKNIQCEACFLLTAANSFVQYKGIKISSAHKDHKVQPSSAWMQCLVCESV